ncbi:TPA: hypothetical protein DEB00_00595 [Candidatus Uhrbacteria bacterium]|nr:hypothetical protein [Candidatus Uhrbacteria bacterium]
MSVTVGQPQEAIRRDVLRTIAFFSLRGQALTPTDVWRWLYRPVSSWTLVQVLEAVQTISRESLLTMQDGRVVLVGHEQIFALQSEQFMDAHRKWKIARRVAWWASLIPGVRLIAIGNTLAWEATRPEGDIDFFVITRPGCVWFVRLLCVTPLILFRARPGVRRKHPIDFTFFVDETQLDLSFLRLLPDDPYLAYWLASLVPLVDDGVFEELWEANRWVQNALPHTTQVVPAWYRCIRSGQRIGRVLYRLLLWTRLMPTGERWARRLSERRFPPAIRRQMNQSTDVVVNEKMLKFHTADKRRAIFDQWEQQCQTYDVLS